MDLTHLTHLAGHARGQAVEAQVRRGCVVITAVTRSHNRVDGREKLGQNALPAATR